MKKFASILIAALALTLIAGIATAALAGTNALTKDIIAANNEKAANEARRAVFSQADTFEEQQLTVDEKTIVYHVAKKGEDTIGYVFTATTKGKSAGMVVMTGVNADGTVCGVKVTENSETAGYIATVTKGGLFEAFIGKTSTDGVDAVSRATKTSDGIIDGVDKALAYYAQIAPAKGE